MLKILKAYVASPTLANATKLRDYARRHPFAECLLTNDQHGIVCEAIVRADNAKGGK